MFRRPQYIAVAAVLLVVLILLNLPTRTAQQVKLALGELFLPLFGVASSSQQLLAKGGDAVVPRQELLRQLESLKKENQQLKLQVTQMGEAWQENQNLRQLLAFQKKTLWRLKAAAVIGRDPANWWQAITINAGSQDGIEANDAVLDPEGHLVGRVASVSLNRAEVVLLGDPACRVSVIVQETRDQGMIVPRSPAPLDTTIANLMHLPRYSEVKPGQKVITSGQGGIFPPGLLVGTIIDSEKPGGLMTEARVRLAADLNHLEDVWVKLP